MTTKSAASRLNSSSGPVQSPPKFKVAMAQKSAPDERLAELQAKLKRAETSVRYARAEYNAACEASNARLEAANTQRAILFDHVKNQTQGAAFWDAKIANQLAENRLQIAAGLVITSRSKLEDREGERSTAAQELDDYIRNSRSARVTRAPLASRESPGPSTSAPRSHQPTSQAERVAQIRAKAAEEVKRRTAGDDAQLNHSPLIRQRQPQSPQQPQRTHGGILDCKPPTPIQSHPKGAPLPALPPRSDAEIYQEWHAQAKLAFANYSALTTFPAPPPPNKPCCNLLCAMSMPRLLLGVCADDIEKAFKTLGLASLKEERLRWHPDRFVRCQEKDQMQAKAKEMFQVLDGIYRKERSERGC